MEIMFGVWRISIEQIVPTDAELSAQYDQIAQKWHTSIGRLGYLAAYRSLFAQLNLDNSLSHLPAEGRVLDCGIGTGALSLALVEQTGLALHLSGIDISPAMLTQADSLLHTKQVTANLTCHDVRHLPHETNSLDLVMGAHVLEHLPCPEAGLREMVRVLRPGAPLVLVMTRCGVFSAWLHLKWHIHCATPEALHHLMTSLGLVDVRHYNLGGPPWCRQMSMAYVGVKPPH